MKIQTTIKFPKKHTIKGFLIEFRRYKKAFSDVKNWEGKSNQRFNFSSRHKFSFPFSLKNILFYVKSKFIQFKFV